METKRRITFWNEKPVTLEGPELKVGDRAPEFSLPASDGSTITLASSQGKTRILCTVPSLETPVCDAETRRFNQEAAALGSSIEVLVVSMDALSAIQRFCIVADIKNLKVMSSRDSNVFGLAYGVQMQDPRLLSRAIFVIDGKNQVRYVEYVVDAGESPNFSAALNAAKEFYL